MEAGTPENLSVLVDWLSVTYDASAVKWQTSMDAQDHLIDPREITEDRSLWRRRPGMLGYRYAGVSTYGTIILWESANSRMGIHVIYPGSALKHLNVELLIKKAVNRARKITRLDISIDVPWELPLAVLKERFQDGQAICGARAYELRDSSSGQTLYIGSRESGRYLRLYNKAAQLELAGTWYRIELECKSDWAGYAAQYLLRKGLQCIPEFIRHFCHWPTVRAYCDAVEATCETPSKTSDRTMSDPEKWLLEQVAPALAKVLAANPEFLSRFLDNVAKKGTYLPHD